MSGLNEVMLHIESYIKFYRMRFLFLFVLFFQTPNFKLIDATLFILEVNFCLFSLDLTVLDCCLELKVMRLVCDAARLSRAGLEKLFA